MDTGCSHALNADLFQDVGADQVGVVIVALARHARTYFIDYGGENRCVQDATTLRAPRI